MFITPVTSYNYLPKMQTRPTFQAAPVKELKELDKLVCPGCGGPIIASEKLTKVFRSISAPLRRIIDAGYMDKAINKPGIWALLNDFANKYPKLSLDKILEDPENYALLRTSVEDLIVPGGHNAPRDVYEKYLKQISFMVNAIKKSSRAELRSASVVMDRLRIFRPYLEEIKKTSQYKAEIEGKLGAFDELTYYAHKYPDKRISEIIDMPNISEYNHMMHEGNKRDFKHKMRSCFYEIRNIIDKTCKYSDTYYRDIEEKVQNILYKEARGNEANRIETDYGVRLKETKEFYKSWLTEIGCEKHYDKICEIVDRMPEMPYTKYTELVSHEKCNNDGMIIISLLNQYIASNDHIEALSEGGPNILSNIMIWHKGCNADRQSLNYGIRSEIYPRMPFYCEQQISQVCNHIYNGRIQKYSLYPFQVSRKLQEQGGGKINPDTSTYRKKMIKKLNTAIETNSTKLGQLKHLRDKKIIEIEQTPIELRESVRLRVEKMTQEINELIKLIKEDKRILKVIESMVNPT